MKVLIIAANQEHVPDPVVPLGAAYVAGAARESGHDVALYDACFDGLSAYQKLANRMTSFDPEVVGLSMRNVDNVAWPRATSYLDHYRRIAHTIRDHFNGPLVLGGSAFTLFPQRFLEALSADYGVVGEGEWAFCSLLEKLAEGGDGSLKGQRLFSHSDARVLPAANPALDLIDVDRYLTQGGAVNIQSKRGCGFLCTYCTYPDLEGRRVRMRPPHEVVDHMERLYQERQIDFFFFVDNVFNIPEQHALEICDELIKRDLPIRWTVYASPAGMSRMLIRAMARAGCESIDFGTDAAADDTLRGLGKSFDTNQILNVGDWCHEFGLKFSHSLIIGGPGETVQTRDKTYRCIEATNPTAVVSILGVRLYPGTAITSRLVQEGLIDANEIGIDPTFFISPDVRDDLLDWAAETSANNGRWWFPGLEGKNKARFFQRCRDKGIRGPLWTMMR